MEHVIEKQLLRKRPDCRETLPQQQRMRRTGTEEGEIIIRPVAEGACGIAPARQKRLRRRKRGKPPFQLSVHLAACRRVPLRQPGLHPLQLCAGQSHAFAPAKLWTISAQARNSSSSVCQISYSDNDGRPIATVCLR